MERDGAGVLRGRMGRGFEDEASVVEVVEGEEKEEEIQLLGWRQRIGWFASPPTVATHGVGRGYVAGLLPLQTFVSIINYASGYLKLCPARCSTHSLVPL